MDWCLKSIIIVWLNISRELKTLIKLLNEIKKNENIVTNAIIWIPSLYLLKCLRNYENIFAFSINFWHWYVVSADGLVTQGARYQVISWHIDLVFPENFGLSIKS